MEALPAGQREALILVDWLELDTDEAGQMLKLSPNAVRVRLDRGRNALREGLGGPR